LGVYCDDDDDDDDDADDDDVSLVHVYSVFINNMVTR
jgi:hypothetical protein